MIQNNPIDATSNSTIVYFLGLRCQTSEPVKHRTDNVDGIGIEF